MVILGKYQYHILTFIRKISYLYNIFNSHLKGKKMSIKKNRKLMLEQIKRLRKSLQEAATKSKKLNELDPQSYGRQVATDYVGSKQARQQSSSSKTSDSGEELVPNPNPEGREKMVTKSYAAAWEKQHGSGGGSQTTQSKQEPAQEKPAEQEPEVSRDDEEKIKQAYYAFQDSPDYRNYPMSYAEFKAASLKNK
jgi:hypothetical protein